MWQQLLMKLMHFDSPCCAYKLRTTPPTNRAPRTTHGPHKLCLEEPENKNWNCSPNFVAVAGATTIPRPTTPPTAIPRLFHDKKQHAHAHQSPGVAPVLITPKSSVSLIERRTSRFHKNNSHYVSAYHAGSQVPSEGGARCTSFALQDQSECGVQTARSTC